MDCKAFENEITRREAGLLDAGQDEHPHAMSTHCDARSNVQSGARGSAALARKAAL